MNSVSSGNHGTLRKPLISVTLHLVQCGRLDVVVIPFVERLVVCSSIPSNIIDKYHTLPFFCTLCAHTWGFYMYSRVMTQPLVTYLVNVRVRREPSSVPSLCTVGVCSRDMDRDRSCRPRFLFVDHFAVHSCWLKITAVLLNNAWYIIKYDENMCNVQARKKMYMLRVFCF